MFLKEDEVLSSKTETLMSSRVSRVESRVLHFERLDHEP